MTVTNPKLVVNHRAKENDPKEITLEKYSHGVRQLLTSIQEKKNKIDTIRKDGVKFDDQSFLTLLFDRLVLKKCKFVCAEVNRNKSAWVKELDAIDINKLISDTTILYTS